MKYKKILFSIIHVFGASVVHGTTDLYTPSVPSIGQSFGVNVNLIQYSITAYMLGTSIIPFFYGYLTDHKGRRISLLTGVTIFFLGSLICVSSPNIWVLIFGRFLQGIGGASVSVTGFAALRDLYTKEEGAKIIAYNGMVISITPALAPVIGGYIEVTLGWQANFWLILSLSIILLTLVLFFFQETLDLKKHKPQANFLKNYVMIFKSKIFFQLGLIHPLLFGSIFCWITVSSVYFIEHLGMSPDKFGIYAMFVVAGYPLGAFSNSKLIPKIGLEKTLLCGLCVAGIATILLGLACFSFPTWAEFIVFTMALFVASLGMCFATTTSMSLSIFPNARGASSAVLHLLRMGGGALGSAYGSYMDDSTLVYLFLYFSFSMVLAFWLYTLIERRNFVSGY